jgi:hypothetical protein
MKKDYLQEILKQNFPLFPAFSTTISSKTFLLGLVRKTFADDPRMFVKIFHFFYESKLEWSFRSLFYKDILIFKRLESCWQKNIVK